MSPTVDVAKTCEAIKFLVDIMEGTDDWVTRLHNYATIKTLCDAIADTMDEEGLWYGDSKCLIYAELLRSCGALAGICPPEIIPSASSARTSADSLLSVYFSHKERD